MHQFITGTPQQVKFYGRCSNIGHAIDMCSTIHEEPIQQVSTAGVFLGLAQRKYDLYANTYKIILTLVMKIIKISTNKLFILGHQ